MRRMPDGRGRFPYSVAYLRMNWEELEPAEGQYQWQVIDEPLRAWTRRGTRIAFRVMTTNAHSRGYYCSPKWLFDAGCRSYEYTVGGDDITSGGAKIARIEPDYGDPLYLAKHAKFLGALAERYDGHPQIEFVDIGSYGPLHADLFRSQTQTRSSGVFCLLPPSRPHEDRRWRWNLEGGQSSVTWRQRRGKPDADDAHAPLPQPR